MPDGDLERRLGEVLRDRAGGFTPSGDLPARIGARTRQRAHNRRVAASMAAVAVLLGIAAPLALRGDGNDQETAALVADSAPAETAAAASEGATSRAAEMGGADTTAGADSADDDAGASATIAGSTEAAPDASPAPPAPVSTSTVPAATTSSAGPPPLLLAVMPGDSRVALVSTTTGQVVRYVEGSDSPGDVFYDDAGEIVFRAGGCGVSGQASFVANDSAPAEISFRDAVTISAWGSDGASPRFAWVAPDDCDGGASNGFTLTIRLPDNDPATLEERTLPVPDVRELAFGPDGNTLVWSESDGLAALDLTDAGSQPRRMPSPDPDCPVVAVTSINGSARVAVTTECAGEPARLFTFDPKSGDAPLDQGTGFAEVDAIDLDTTAQWIIVTHASGTDVVSAATSEVVATIPGARSAHWTTATS